MLKFNQRPLNNFRSKNTLCKKGRTLIVFLAALLFSFSYAQGQCSLTSLSGTFTPLTGGTVLPAIQSPDASTDLINIGFIFKYNGKEYTSFRAYSYGYIGLNILTTYGGDPSLSFVRNAIMPLGDSHSGIGGQASYKTEGTAPNRVLTVEWLNWKWNRNASQSGISFQLKLHETTNQIEYIYRQESGILSNPSAYIGLSYDNGKYFSLTNSGTSPVLNSSLESLITTKPATGQIYRFDALINPVSDNHVTKFSSIVSGSAKVQWTDASGTNLPSRYLIKVSNLSFADITNPVNGTEVLQNLDLKDGSGAVYVDSGKQQFKGWIDSIGNTTLYMKIFPVSNYNIDAKYKVDVSVPQLTISVPPYQARILTASGIGSTSLTLNWKGDLNTNCVVFAKENGSGKASPVNNITYTASANYGSGTPIGSSGWYCVYNGPSNTAIITSLKTLTSYAFHVLQYTGAAGAEQYSTVDMPSAQIVQLTSLFDEQTTISLPGVNQGSIKWGDFDNDEDLDFILTGYNGSNPLTQIYRNNGSNSFTLLTSLTGVFGSADWGDYNNDGYLDILLAGSTTAPTRVSKVYKNNGDGTFTEQTDIKLTGVNLGSVNWVDYDGDGWLDIFLVGSTGSGNVAKLYRNNGNNTFNEQTSIKIEGVTNASASWGDYDNDGDQDLLLAGLTNSNKKISKIYQNIGNNNFTEQTGIAIDGVTYGCSKWGDFNNDGYLDFVITGNAGSKLISKIYSNNRDNTFKEQTAIVLAGVTESCVSWADYDNDGNLDLQISGNNLYSKVTRIYKNNGDSTFSEQPSLVIKGVNYGSSAWGDYDGDGDLDLLLSGYTSEGTYITKVYLNGISVPNILPLVPQSLESTVNSDAVLKWDPVITDATKALSYNVRVGSTPGGSNIVSPMANSANGYRRIAGYGNSQLNTSCILHNLKKGTYYWSVQAIDNSFAGGSYASEQSFTYTANNQASAVNIASNTLVSVKCSWTRGNGDKCAVFVKENGAGAVTLTNNTTYAANKAYDTSVTQVGTSGWFCVYNGDLDTATITNLKANTEYRFQVIEYSGSPLAEVYSTATGAGNPAQYLPPFSEQTQIALTGVSGSTQAWGDYDNDGNLDVIIAGYTGSASIVELYKNNGDNTFSKTSNTFAVNTVYDVAWGDFDNDGDLDLLIASTLNSKVFENKGDGTFAEKASLADVFMGKCLWVELDNDGYKDVILTGSGGTKIYKNNHNGTFTLQTITLPTVSNYSSVACGDYDNDGDLDILLAGLDSDASTEITKVFKNDGNFTFTEQTGIVLQGVANCSVAWADMDNDGDMDIVLTGGGADVYTKIYDNNGNGTFTELAQTFKGLFKSAVSIADYDNDGYRDLIVSGTVSDADYYTLVYHNNGNKTYTPSAVISFPGVQVGSVAFGDFDNDGDLDLFLSGISVSGRIAKIFRNNGAISNVEPGVPTSLSYSLKGNNVSFSWSRPSDDKTAAKGLTYSFYVYETSTTGYAKSSESLTGSNAMNGRRLVARIGEIQSSTVFGNYGYNLKGLPAGNYKWSIQAIDAGLLGGAFAMEGSFSISDLTKVGIDFGESQITNTTTSLVYSFNSTNGIDGTWSRCASGHTNVDFKAGGFDVWVQQNGNSTINRKVANIPVRSAAPGYTINYLAVTTTQNAPFSVEYSSDYSFSSTSIGTDSPIPITSGTTLYVRIKATSSTLASYIQTLAIPNRPATPIFTIDYVNETTKEVSYATTEYSSNADMSGATTGANAKIQVIPDQELYIRKCATSTSFASVIQILSPEARLSAPNFTIDFINEILAQTVSSTVEFSNNADMSGATGSLSPDLKVTPGKNLYLRYKASGSFFASATQALLVPMRPEAPAEPVVEDFLNTFNWANNPLFVNASDYEYSLTNGVVWSDCTVKPVSVGNITLGIGIVKVRVKATENSFAGTVLASNAFYSIGTGINDLSEAGVTIFPNPASDVLHIGNLPEKSKVSIYTIDGKRMKENVFVLDDNEISVNDLPSGIYLINIKTDKTEVHSKFVKK